MADMLSCKLPQVRPFERLLQNNGDKEMGYSFSSPPITLSYVPSGPVMLILEAKQAAEGKRRR